MSEELAPGVYSLKPFDIVVYQNSLGHQRQYTILSVIVGVLGEEGFVEVEPTINPSTPLHFPITLLNAAVESGRVKIYSG